MLILESKLVYILNLFLNIEAVTIGPFILNSSAKISPLVLRHEKIHAEQWFEMMYIFFPFVYCFDFIVGIFQGKSIDEAYKGIRAEKEAYMHEKDKNYLRRRKRWDWLSL